MNIRDIVEARLRTIPADGLYNVEAGCCCRLDVDFMQCEEPCMTCVPAVCDENVVADDVDEWGDQNKESFTMKPIAEEIAP